MKYISNVVDNQTLSKIQLEVLQDLSNILIKSFGPMGSNTCIKKENALNQYTKDGHTILSNIYFNGIIEQSIKDDIESITRHIVKTVGDGTTSAVILSKYIMYLIENDTELQDYAPAEINRALDKACNYLKIKIKDSAKETTVDDIFDIAMISTNGNQALSNIITNIYKEFGLHVFIDVSPNIANETLIKAYDGMTINTGFADSCYITDAAKNQAVVDHPEIYFFEHPIDTKEMGVFMDSIIATNIIAPFTEKRMEDIIPTVIIAPKISQDMSSYMDSLITYMNQMQPGNKFPVLFITEFHQHEELMDIAKLCGGKMIRKYIDANIYKQDVENGLAPTPETIKAWAGNCDEVVADSSKTKFLNPFLMKEEDGEYSNIYKNLLNFLETELSRATADGEDARVIGTLKRRLHSLKCNLVELVIGGITMADRDSLRDLAEDAILNCRSAVENGLGFGANFSALLAIFENHKDFIDRYGEFSAEGIIYRIIKDSYYNLVADLYRTVFSANSIAELDLEKNPLLKCLYVDKAPINLRDKESYNVKSSIQSDIVIMDTVCKIVGIMATCNQFMVPSPAHNVYTDFKTAEELKEKGTYMSVYGTYNLDAKFSPDLT